MSEPAHTKTSSAPHPVQDPTVSDESSSPAESKIHTDHRTTASTRTSIFHRLARSIRPHLVNGSGKPLPPGSPQLAIDSVATKKCHVREYQVEDVWLYELRPKTSHIKKKGPSSHSSSDEEDGEDDTENIPHAQGHKNQSELPEPSHDLYYFAGGGFSSPPSPQHWRFFTKLSTRLPQYRLTIVSYPLAPSSPAPSSIPLLQSLLSTLLTTAHTASPPRSITLAGDSAGGNLALILGIDAVTRTLPGHLSLKNLLAICPVVDLRNTHPDMPHIDSFDPLLTASFTDAVAARWSSTWPRDHPLLSPVVSDLHPLAEAGVQVHGVVADRDVLSPDTVVFKQKCEEAGVGGEWLEWEKMMHCFPLAGAYGKVFPESWEGLEWIIGVLERHA
ncbi:MAG: hypothetical protein Q9227_003654 [Pyrenula ochraceoflavens]